MGIFKKSLGIVLAGATLMTAGAVIASADAPKYDDKDSIYYNEAVDVLSTLGVMNGRDPQYNDGKADFDPTATLTRAEGCKIIVKLLNMDGVVGVGSFTDVAPDFWAASEIAYCQREGIVNGYGDGRFGPDDTLTGSQFAKMLLVAAGYDAEIEGMSGPQWEISVAKMVRSTDLDESLKDYNPTNPISREQAAQMAFNLLMTPVVEYENKGTSLSINGAELNFGASNAKPISRNRNSYTENVFTDRTNTGDTAQGRVVEFAEEHWTDLVLDHVGDPDTEDKKSAERGFTPDDFGRPSRKWMYKNAEIGTYVAKVNLLKEFHDKVTLKDLYDLLGKSTYDSLVNGTTKLVATVDGNRYNLSYDSVGTSGLLRGASTLNAVSNDLYSSNFRVGGGTAYRIEDYVDKSNINNHFVNRTDTGAVNDTDNGSVTEVYLDNNTHYVYVCTYNTYVYQAVNDYNSARASVNLSEAGNTDEYGFTHLYNGKNFNNVSENDLPDSADQIKSLKTDDYALVTLVDKSEYVKVGNNFYIADQDYKEYEIKSVDKAELKSGKVTSYNSEGNERVSLDGTAYQYSKTALKDKDTASGSDGVKSTTYTIGDTAKLVLDKFGYIIAVDDARSTNDYVFIRTFGNNSNFVNTPVADAYFSDGTTATIYVKEAYDYSHTIGNDVYVSNKSDLANNFYVNDMNWYTYTKNSANEYTLNPIERKYDVYGTRSQSANNSGTLYEGFGYSADFTYFYDSSATQQLNNLVDGIGWDSSTITNYQENHNRYFLYTNPVAATAKGTKISQNDKTQFLLDGATLYLLANGETNETNARISTRLIGSYRYSADNNGTFSFASDEFRANSDTIFIVNDNVKDKVNRYVGYKNAPEITLLGSYADVYVVDDAGYAKMVYIDINSYSGTAGNNAHTSVSGNTSQVAYIIKYDGKTTAQNADNVYSYIALNPSTGEEYTIMTDEMVTELDNGKDGYYDTYIVRDSGKAGLSILDKIDGSVNSNGELVAKDSDTFVRTGLDYPISFSGGVLTMVDGTAYTIASDAKITLITLGRNTDGNNIVYSDATVINNNASNDYEVQLNLTGKQLENALKPYYYIYGVSGKMSGSGDDETEIKELYVTVQYAWDGTAFAESIWNALIGSYDDDLYDVYRNNYSNTLLRSGVYMRYNQKYTTYEQFRYVALERYLDDYVNGYSVTSFGTFVDNLKAGNIYV